jgi:hypothetical protein
MGQVEDAVTRGLEEQERRQPFHVEQPDGTPPPPAEVRRVHPGEATREGQSAMTIDEAQAKMDAAMAEMRKREADKPPMSLMEAIASGKLDFGSRGPQ